MDRLAEFTQSIQQFRQQVKRAVPTALPKVLPCDFKPGPKDVICARGRKAQLHPGNLRLQMMIEMSLERYVQATAKVEKSLVVSEIVSSVYDADGLFVRMDGGGRWCQIDVSDARKKTGQTLRESIYKSMKRAPGQSKAEARKGLTLQSNQEAPMKVCGQQDVDIDASFIGSSTDCKVFSCFADNSDSYGDLPSSTCKQPDPASIISGSVASIGDTSSLSGESEFGDSDDNGIYEPLPCAESLVQGQACERLKDLAPILQFWFDEQC